MDYNKNVYEEMYEILDNNKGSIDSKYIDEIFQAFQVASGQGFFKTRMKAIMDYLSTHSFVIIKYSELDVKLGNHNDIERCFQKHDRTFKITDL
ncbi:hypothetical protein [Saccharicrinis fermentans]|uniref:Uncharacterized protein n=1 Tax=Saccharicrinis fermentans DSM 9555 = JCM 21142 TaxID=869213 RepID=W7YMU1_9BACT|nr:hypothetical protein [Saccharicrinis fermentans]GAF05996.1 hypothetical protein JCM21142_134763 [Saccharicrinis fermentans DSM 9555 = JCM 21142]